MPRRSYTRAAVPTQVRAADSRDPCDPAPACRSRLRPLDSGFWLSHPMLTAIVSALVVVVLSLAVIEVVLSRRAERRWRVLAQTALMELGEAASTSLEGPGRSA